MEVVCWMDGLKRRDEATEVSDVSRPEHLTTRSDPVLVVGQGSLH